MHGENIVPANEEQVPEDTQQTLHHAYRAIDVEALTACLRVLELLLFLFFPVRRTPDCDLFLATITPPFLSDDADPSSLTAWYVSFLTRVIMLLWFL